MYPSAPSGRSLQVVRARWFSDRPNRPPIIDFNCFDNPNNAHVAATTVIVAQGIRRHKYIIYGYFDSAIPINYNLSEICPDYPWKGELMIFSLGRRIRLLSRPSGNNATIERAIKSYVPSFQYQCHIYIRLTSNYLHTGVQLSRGEFSCPSVESSPDGSDNRGCAMIMIFY